MTDPTAMLKARKLIDLINVLRESQYRHGLRPPVILPRPASFLQTKIEHCWRRTKQEKGDSK